jgi:hypothetical protein
MPVHPGRPGRASAPASAISYPLRIVGDTRSAAVELEAQRYYTRALSALPYGPGAALVHAEGSRQGGGYEWSAAPDAAPMLRGHTCIELDEAGKISRLTAIYDSSLLSYAAYQSLAGLAAEAPLS